MANATIDATELTAEQIVDEARDVVPDPEAWLETPNMFLSLRSPREMIDSGSQAERRLVWNLIESIKYGFFT
ncbi:MAG TPA: antitoxin Xre/MbcA/ParS toxin-binding domain-containing protein [Blastocatellia bacterium]